MQHTHNQEWPRTLPRSVQVALLATAAFILTSCSDGRPSAELLDQVIRGECCPLFDEDVLTLTDGTILAVLEPHPLTGRTAYGFADLVEGYCTAEMVTWEGQPVTIRGGPTNYFNIAVHLRDTKRAERYLERPVIISTTDTRMSYASNAGDTQVEYPATEYVTTSEHTRHRAILDPSTCDLTFHRDIVHTRYTTTWVDLKDRWAVRILVGDQRYFPDYVEISKR